MINVGVLQAILRLKDELTPQLKKAVDSTIQGAARMAKAAAAAAAAVAVAAGAFLFKSTQAASKAQETQNLFEVAFGEMSKAAEDWAQRTQAATGINDTILKQFSATLQSILVPMGVTKEASYELSTSFTQLAFDIASLRDVPFEQAFNALSSGLVGEAEPLKKLGISVLENTIKQTEFAKAILATGRQLSETEKIQARSISILQQSTIAQGDQIKTQTSWANQTRIIGEVWTDLLETVGTFVVNSAVLGSAIRALNAGIVGLSASIEANEEKWQGATNNGVFFFLRGLEQSIRVRGFLVEATGAVTTGLGLITQSFASVAQTVLDTTPIFSLLPDTIRSKFQESIDSVRGIGDSIRQSGEMIFVELGGGIGETADAVGEAIQRMIDSTGEQGEASDAAAVFAEKYQTALEMLQNGSIGAAGATDTLTRAQIALESQIQKTALSLGTAGLLREMDLMRGGLLRVLESSDRLSQSGFADLSAMIDELVANGLAVPPLFHAMVDEFLATNVIVNEATGRFSQLKSILPGLVNVTYDLRTATDDLRTATEKAAESMFDFAGGLFGVADIAGALADVIGGRLGQALDGISQTLGGFGDIGAGIGRVLSGDIIGGIVQGIQGIGGVISGIASLFSGGPDLIRDAARDLGATISDELAKSIEESGRPIQLAIAEIFREGGFESIDRFAEEVGDIFSGLERGEFSKPEAILALEQSIPILLRNFEELGPEGEAQIQRIINAAQSMGLEFDGLSELIKATLTDEALAEMGLVGEKSIQRIRDAAVGLGVDFDFLFDKIQSTFAPSTMEEIAEQFGFTNQQVRDLGKKLGIDIQTDLERMAATVGLSVSEFQALGEAVGLPLEQIAPLLAALGVDAASLAASLGVDVAGGAAGVDEALANSNIQLDAGIELAASYANQIERAARASRNISFPSVPNVPNIPNVPTTGAAHGFEGRVTGPHNFFIEPGITEDVSIRRPGGGGAAGGAAGGGGGGGGGVVNKTTITVNLPTGVVATNKNELANAIKDAVGVVLRDRLGGSMGAIEKNLDGTFQKSP